MPLEPISAAVARCYLYEYVSYWIFRDEAPCIFARKALRWGGDRCTKIGHPESLPRTSPAKISAVQPIDILHITTIDLRRRHFVVAFGSQRALTETALGISKTDLQ